MASTKKVNYDTVFQDKQNVNWILRKRNKNKTNRSKVYVFCSLSLFACKFISNEQQKYVESADKFNLFHFDRHSIEAFGTWNWMKCNGKPFLLKALVVFES